LRDYVEQLYEPAAKQAKEMSAKGWQRARALQEWKSRVRETWEDVRVAEVEGSATAADVGEQREVFALVRLGRLSTDDVAVELAHGRVGASGELIEPQISEMTPTACEEGTCSYRGAFVTDAPGLYGYAVRVVPNHPDLANRMEMGLLAWAR
ncbi:MAG: DUF3417 domain-containing protein, partial [Actinomycetota bacterium]|nr:DUF3417 domain-containing protein [Actinomycetota bacterium]